MKKIKEPMAVGFIKRDTEVVRLMVRIPPELKAEIEDASEKLDCSINKFTEAALNWYLANLKKEGSL
jgi:predicted HicB family RNase H-like nuclease